MPTCCGSGVKSEYLDIESPGEKSEHLDVAALVAKSMSRHCGSGDQVEMPRCYSSQVLSQNS